MSTDNINRSLEAILPACLDDIIKINRHQLKLERVFLDSLTHLSMSFPITNLQGVLEEVFLYKRILLEKNQEAIYLVGFKQCDVDHDVAWHTSSVKGIDFENNVVLTNSGSHYLIQSFAEGEPHLNLLLMICHMAHRDGWGNQFGIAPIYY